MRMYALLVISFLVGAFLLVYWKITQDRISNLKEVIAKQERMLNSNLSDVREEYARVFREFKRKESARELLGV